MPLGGDSEVGGHGFGLCIVAVVMASVCDCVWCFGGDSIDSDDSCLHSNEDNNGERRERSKESGRGRKKERETETKTKKQRMKKGSRNRNQQGR